MPKKFVFVKDVKTQDGGIIRYRIQNISPLVLGKPIPYARSSPIQYHHGTPPIRAPIAVINTPFGTTVMKPGNTNSQNSNIFRLPSPVQIISPFSPLSKEITKSVGLVTKNNEVLMVLDTNKTWKLPGGTVMTTSPLSSLQSSFQRQTGHKLPSCDNPVTNNDEGNNKIVMCKVTSDITNMTDKWNIRMFNIDQIKKDYNNNNQTRRINRWDMSVINKYL